MPYQLRELTEADGEAAYRLGAIAFGYIDRPIPTEFPAQPGRTSWGLFDGATLVARAIDRHQSHYYGGQAVAASGVAGVAVRPESRGTGVGRQILTHLLAAARDRGAVISTLFDSTPFPYRRLGWEECGALLSWLLPSAELAGLRVPAGVTLRPATEADVPAMYDAYNQLASEAQGVMPREKPLYGQDPAKFLGDFTGITVAVDAGDALIGYCAWDRVSGYGEKSKLEVDDLISLTPDALTGLLASLASWASVARKIRIRQQPLELALLHANFGHATIESRNPWMLRLIDAPAAVAARGWPAHLSGAVDLAIEDPTCPWNAGDFRLAVSGGQGRLESGGPATVRIGSRGLALLWSGAATPAAVRRAGLMTGGSAEDDAFLAAATAGPAPQIVDYF
jgi:predicted acetyltransferase